MPLAHYATMLLCHYAAMPLCHYATMKLCHYACFHPASIWTLPSLKTLITFSSFVSFVASGSDRWRLKRRRSSVARRQTLSRSFFFIVESRKRKSNCKSVRVMVSETEREYLRERVCACTCVCECVWGRKKNYFSRLEEKRWLGLTNMFWLSAFGKGEKVFFLTRNQSRRRSINDF